MTTTQPMPPTLPKSVHDALRKAAQLCAETANDKALDGHCGPKGPQDKLLEYGIKSVFGNCTVELIIKLTP